MQTLTSKSTQTRSSNKIDLLNKNHNKNRLNSPGVTAVKASLTGKSQLSFEKSKTPVLKVYSAPRKPSTLPSSGIASVTQPSSRKNAVSSTFKKRISSSSFSKKTSKYRGPQNTPVTETPQNIVHTSKPPRASLSQEELHRIAVKFQELSSSILDLATSNTTLEIRSLEALLTREISLCLGNSVNNPKFSQGFVESTRSLVNNLISVYEEGKVNPQLIKNHNNISTTALKAHSSSTVCYRDRYLKELVMSMLQSMCSSEVEEEISQVPRHLKSEASKERIRAIRDMVRAEAGIDPAAFKKADKHLEDLRQRLSEGKSKILRATMEVEEAISKHLVTINSIPADKGASTDGTKDSQTMHAKCNNDSDKRKAFVRSEISYKIKGSPIKDSIDLLENPTFPGRNNIQEKLAEVKEQTNSISITENKPKDWCSKKTPSNITLNSFVLKDEGDYDDDNDEINEDETRQFLEALKSEIEERNKIPKNSNIRVYLGESSNGLLERIDENYDDENEIFKEDLAFFAKLQPTGKYQTVNTVNDDIIEKQSFPPKEIVLNCQQKTDKNKLDRISSKWWMEDQSVVQEIMAEMRRALEAIPVSPNNSEQTFDYNEFEERNSDVTKQEFDFTVEEISIILSEISEKMLKMSKYLKENDSTIDNFQKERLISILNVLDKSLNYSNPTKFDLMKYFTEDEGATQPIVKMSQTFSFLSETLSRTPQRLKHLPFSKLTPPESLNLTLAFMASTAYFRDCFISSIVKKRQAKLNKTSDSDKRSKTIKYHHMSAQRSSAEFVTDDLLNNSSKNTKKLVMRDFEHQDDVDKHITKFEHYLGLTASVMTVQNVSDMFLYLSSVMNDVPERVKSEKILNLNPPPTLLKALEILYSEDDCDTYVGLQKTTSFTSLTIQNVSDFLLTISRTFQDTPERVRNSIILDLNPPKSLVKAITLLTSLSHHSIVESLSQEDVEDSTSSALSESSQDRFYDAVDSVSSFLNN